MEEFMGQQKLAYIQAVRKHIPDFRFFQEFLCLFHCIHVDADGIRHPVFGKKHTVRLFRVSGVGYLHTHGLGNDLGVSAFIFLHDLYRIFPAAGHGVFHPVPALSVVEFAVQGFP